MGKKILQLGAGPLMIHSIKKIKEMGHQVFAVDKNPDSPGFKFADGFKAIDIKDTDQVLKYANDLQIDAIIALNEAGVYTEAYVSEKMNLVSNSSESTKFFTDKGYMREKWKEKNLSQPEFIVVDSSDKIRDAINQLKLPVILKPCLNWGSKGVSLINTEEEIEWAINFAKENCSNERYIIEKYIKGIEMTVEGLVKESKLYILATSDKVAQDHKNFRVAMALNYPSFFNSNVMRETKLLMDQSIEALQIKTGAVHAELMVNDDGVFLIELAGRPGGGHIFGIIVEAVSGISMPKALTKLKLKEDVNLKLTHQKGVCYRFFTPPKGIFKKITGLEEAKSLDSILDMDFQMEEGTVVNDIAGDASRPGFIVSKGETRISAMENAEKALSIIGFESIKK